MPKRWEKHFLIVISTGLCLGSWAMAAEPEPHRSFAELQSGPWQIRQWSGRSFTFLSRLTYATWSQSDVTKRIAAECEKQGLLTPIWADSTWRSMSGPEEWDWVIHWFMTQNKDIQSFLAGRDRRTCYYVLKTYYLAEEARKHVPNQGVLSMAGHFNFAHYGAQWGADIVGQEIGENIVGTQGKIAFLRGAARQTGIPWFVDVSQWYADFGHWARREPGDASSVPLYLAGHPETAPVGNDVVPANEATGFPSSWWNGGHSTSFLARCWYMTWLSGVTVLTPEACLGIFFAYDPAMKDQYVGRGVFVPKDPAKRAVLSPLGLRAQAFTTVTRNHPDRGVPFTPFALFLDEYCGFNGSMAADDEGFKGNPDLTCPPRPWGVMAPTWGDRQIHLFLDTVFPRSMYLDMLVGRTVGPADEKYRLVDSPYGDTFDVLLSNAPEKILASYPVLIVLGDHEFLPATTARLKDYVKGGGRLYLTPDHVVQLGPRYEDLRRAGRVEVFGVPKDRVPARIDVTRWYQSFLPRASDAEIKRRLEGLKLQPFEVSFKNETVRLMASLRDEFLPVRVDGKVEYTINRGPTGWVIGLINNEGIEKGVFTPVKIDLARQQTVRVELKAGRLGSAAEWCTDRKLSASGNAVTVEIPPGEVRVVQLQTRDERPVGVRQ